MSLVLDNGYALPGTFAVDDVGMPSVDRWYDYGLRIGKIVAVVLPDSKDNFNKKFIEYAVETQKTDGDSGEAPIIYPRCLLMNRFGGVADFERWTPRMENDDGDGYNLGSWVLLLCVNGKSRSALIVGGVPHIKTQTSEAKFQDNHRYEKEFNGISEKINNDGEWLWNRRGPTKSDGSVRSSDGSGFSFLAKNDGNTFLGYNLTFDSTSATDKCSIQFDKNNKQLNLFAESNIHSETNDKFIIQTTNGVKINQGGADSQAFVRGTTYRNNEVVMHTKLQLQLQTLSTLISTAATLVQTVATFHKIPVYGPMLGSVPLNAVGLALSNASQMISQMKSAIETFEQSKKDYLSTHHEFAENA